MTLMTDTLDSLWQVVAVGLLLGAGLPALFALGLRSLASGSGPEGTSESTLMGKLGAAICFVVVVVAVASGILLLTEDFLTSTFGIKVF